MEHVDVSEQWNKAHRLLVQNVLEQDFVPWEEASTNHVVSSLPAYVPYIGAKYFDISPRIMCIAINQNLSKHARWTEDWVGKWKRNNLHAVDRLNWSHKQDEALPIKPYAEGFIPLVAAMAWAYYGTKVKRNLPCTIDDIISVTNFVKFSTPEDALSTSIPETWWQESGKRYVHFELEVLKPDIIITIGSRTLKEVNRILPRQDVVLLPCRFPARIPSLITSPLSSTELRTWTKHLLPLVDTIRCPKISLYHKQRMKKFPKYFIDVAKCWNLHFPE